MSGAMGRARNTWWDYAANDIVGIIVRAAIDRDRGGSGVRGAIEGEIAEDVVKLVMSLVVTFAIGLGAQLTVCHGMHAVTGDDDLRQS